MHKLRSPYEFSWIFIDMFENQANLIPENDFSIRFGFEISVS